MWGTALLAAPPSPSPPRASQTLGRLSSHLDGLSNHFSLSKRPHDTNTKGERHRERMFRFCKNIVHLFFSFSFFAVLCLWLGSFPLFSLFIFRFEHQGIQPQQPFIFLISPQRHSIGVVAVTIGTSQHGIILFYITVMATSSSLVSFLSLSPLKTFHFTNTRVHQIKPNIPTKNKIYEKHVHSKTRN